MNTAYRHLDSKLRIAELTIPQWLGVFAGVITALIYAMYLHPLGTTFTLMSAVYIGGVPAGTVFLANTSEFDLWTLVRSAAGWTRSDGRYLPGPGSATAGYRVTASVDERERRAREQRRELDLEHLWSQS